MMTHITTPRQWLAVSAVAVLGAATFPEAPSSTSVNDPVFTDLLGALDSNHDGVLEPFEAAEAAISLTRQADEDGDGAASFEELGAWLQQSIDDRTSEAAELVADLDEDEDGALSAGEIPGELRPFLPAEIDADGNGRLTVAEIVEANPFASARPMIEAEFLGLLQELDPKDKGFFRLDALDEEWGDEVLEEIAGLDLDRDGRVTKEELIERVDEELRGAEFSVDGTVARMSGVIGPSTPGRVLELLVSSPAVETIELVDVPGSMDDEANLRAARMLHEAGLRTRVAANGEIASGGVDFFLAGHERSLGEGARLGVHSWAGGDGETGRDLPRSHPAHTMFLDFYRDVGVSPDFYWYTLEAAPAEGIHWMTAAEIRQYDAGEIARDGHASAEPTHLGGCVLIDASSPVPADPFEVTVIRSGGELAPFQKSLSSAGIEFRAERGVSDEFLELTAAACSEMFRETEGKARDLQREVVSAMHARRALLPVPLTEESLEDLFESAEEEFEAMERSHSVCDIIMAETPARMQVMEVVEHLLHTVTDVGLASVFPDEWGLTRTSSLGLAMEKAIAEGHYNLDGYEDLDGAPREVRERILLQEFAYWYLTTRWNLQETYGPDEDEWTLRSPEELAKAFPVFDEVVSRTADLVLSSPTPKTLAAIANQAKERER